MDDRLGLQAAAGAGHRADDGRAAAAQEEEGPPKNYYTLSPSQGCAGEWLLIFCSLGFDFSPISASGLGPWHVGERGAPA